MDLDPRWWILLGSNILLIWLSAMVNDVLGPLGIYLNMSALFVIMPASCLSHRWGLLLVFITGLCVDAALPVIFGFHAVLYAITLTILHTYQYRLARAGLGQLILIALVVNLAFMLTESVFWAGKLLENSLYWLRVATDILMSTMAVALIGWWFFSWERWLLLVTGSRVAAPEKT